MGFQWEFQCGSNGNLWNLTINNINNGDSNPFTSGNNIAIGNPPFI